jgi:hypothetical protein
MPQLQPWNKKPGIQAIVHDNLDYANFVTINRVHISSSEAHVCLQKMCYTDAFWYQQTADELCLHKILWTGKAYFMLEDLLKFHNSRSMSRGKCGKHGYQGHFTALVSLGISLLVPKCRTTNWLFNGTWFSGKCSNETASRYVCCNDRVVCDIFGTWDWTRSVNCMASVVVESNKWILSCRDTGRSTFTIFTICIIKKENCIPYSI